MSQQQTLNPQRNRKPVPDTWKKQQERRTRIWKWTPDRQNLWDAATLGASMAVLAILFPILCVALVRSQPTHPVSVNLESMKARVLSEAVSAPERTAGMQDAVVVEDPDISDAAAAGNGGGDAISLSPAASGGEDGAALPNAVSGGGEDGVPLSNAVGSGGEDGVPLSNAVGSGGDGSDTEDYALKTAVSKGGKSSGLLSPRTSARTVALAEDLEQSTVKSRYAVVLDAQTGEILAERNSEAVMNPASMTKVLTILVAAETLKDPKFGPSLPETLNSPVCITRANRDYCWSNGCSVAGFFLWETVTLRDCLYATILPSGADGAYALAVTCAGSHEGFVELMNRKAKELGLSESAHFTNCVGLYNAEHHCTVRDMAIIMKAALDNPVCRTVLTTMTWTTSANDKHPYGIFLRNRFLYQTPNLVPNATMSVVGAKTGYVRQAGCCAVSVATREDGNEYICVTGMSWSSNQVIRDHGSLYERFCANA